MANEKNENFSFLGESFVLRTTDGKSLEPANVQVTKTNVVKGVPIFVDNNSQTKP